MKASRTRVGVRMCGAVAVLLASVGPAQAFYWFDWPGSRIPPEQRLAPPVQVPPGPSQGRAGPPNGPPPRDRVPTPPLDPELPIDRPPLTPQPVPEPSAGLAALLGLGALVARRWKHKK